MKVQIIDATIASTSKQRNSREENKQIKEEQPPQDWNKNKQSQKDTDARWTKKNGKNFFGYKNHVNVDVKNKLIHDYKVTTASVHGSNVFEELLDYHNASRAVYMGKVCYFLFLNQK